MEKKFMGKFLALLGFEDRENDEPEQEPQQESNPYSTQSRTTNTGSVPRQPVRRRMEEAPPSPPVPLRRAEESRVVPMGIPREQSAAGGMRMVVYQPQSYDDTQRIIDDLKSGRPVIANLEDLNVEIAQRVLDFLSGAVYGVDGNIRKVSRGIFVLAPPHVDISGNVLSTLTNDLRSGRGSYFSTPRRPE